MLGKRPRPLLRPTSKSQLMPNDPFDCPPASCQQAMLCPSPAFVSPRQVIGFNPVRQNLNCEESPRSVQDPKALDGIAKVASQEKQVKSPRSPRSGLESLLSSPRPWDKKGSEGVGLGLVVAIHAKEDDAAKGRAAEVAQGPTALVSEVAPFKCCSARSPTRSQPIPIAQTHLQSSSLGKTLPSKAAHEDEHQASAWSRQGTRTQTRGLRVVVDDEEMESRESIFSTASPASSWNEYIGDLPLIDFLNSCFFCKRLLAPGKDIFMYRGDRAFCSAECRYQQIVIDERKERCAPISYRAGAAVASGASDLRTRVLAATTIAAA